MSLADFRVLLGWAVIDGYQPDGDTIRFVPDDMRAFQRLERSYLATVGSDTSVSVRLEGIDAPELHYVGAEQPAAKPALDALLKIIHWPPPADQAHPSDVPRGVRVAVLTSACDSHGRVIGYVFPSEVAFARPTAAGLLRRETLSTSANARLAAAGVVYPLAYRSQSPAHRALFRQLARAARRRGAGVWARDDSQTGFALRSEASLGPFGALVFPKLFRRSVVFFREARRGVSFAEWLRADSTIDDKVSVAGGAFKHLSSFVRDRAGHLRLAADLLAMTFAET